MPTSSAYTRAQLDELVAGAEVPLAILMTLYTARAYQGAYRTFPRSLESGMIFAEIIVHATSRVDVSGWVDNVSIAQFRASYRPTNVSSIADATGIPRETVRRKVRSLLDAGWIRRTDEGGLLPAPPSATNLSAMSNLQGIVETVEKFLVTARQVQELLERRRDQLRRLPPEP